MVVFEVEVEWRGGQFVVTERSPRARAEGRSAHPPPEDEGPSFAAERRALEWLESQPVPVVVASVAPRSTFSSVYVPVSDADMPVAEPQTAWQAVHLGRPRRSVDRRRSVKLSAALVRALVKAQCLLAELLPAETPEDKAHEAEAPGSDATPDRDEPEQIRFRLVWSQAPPASVRTAVSALCRRALSSDAKGRRLPAPPMRTPDDIGRTRRRMPMKKKDADSDLGRDWVVFAGVGGSRQSVVRCVEVADTVRTLLVEHAQGAPSPLIADDGPAAMAIVPLPFVAHSQVSVPLLGVALIWTRELGLEARRAVLRSIVRWELAAGGEARMTTTDSPRLTVPVGSAPWMIQRVRDAASTPSLRPWTWCAPSLEWATATPIALDKDAGFLDAAPPDMSDALEVAEIVVAAGCTEIGLPKPSAVDVSLASVLPGSVHSRAFPAFPSYAETERRALVHARIRFPTPVRGPLLLGAGRMRGLGLCRPVA